MRLSDQHITDFIAMYQRHYSVQLGRDEALAMATRLCRFVHIVSTENEHGYENNQN